MKSFDHPNVLGLIGVCLDLGPAPYIVTKCMSNGSLVNFLKKERHTLTIAISNNPELVKIHICCRCILYTNLTPTGY